MLGLNWRPDYDLSAVRRDLEIIRSDLHCNAVRLQGRDPVRLVAASRAALSVGLDVWFSPELWDHAPEATLDYVARGAGLAQQLLEEAPGRVVLSVGSELSLFGYGFIPGENVLERLKYPKLRDVILSPTHRANFSAFVGRLAEAARQQFRGPITYAAVPFELVDWGPFDYVGVDLYRGDPMFDRYPELLRRYTSLDKPFVNMEFGCCTFRGADRLGGRGWEIVDWGHWPPKLRGEYVYDQAAQANEVATLLRLNDEAGAYGTFVFTFIEPGAGLPPGVSGASLPKLDFDADLPRYALVKSFYPEAQRGATYPDVAWEPKESFRAVASLYGAP